jgi:hypothetical protein
MVKRKELKKTFNAVDIAGKRRTLRQFVDIIDVGHVGDPDAEVEGIKAILTSEGNHVNWLGSKQYRVVETGELLTSDDPDAP